MQILPPSGGFFMEKQPLIIAFLMAHPDDEAIPFGLPSLLSENGHQVHIVSLTDGSLGSHTLRSRRKVARIRKKEFTAAAAVLGASPHILGSKDGQLQPTQQVKMKLLKTLRQINPDIVLIPHRDDYHDDHVQTHEIAKWATFHLPDGPLRTRRNLFQDIPPTEKSVALYQVDTQGSQTWNNRAEDTGQDTQLSPVSMIIELSASSIDKSLHSFLQHKSQLGPREEKLSYPELAVRGALRRGRQAGFRYGVGVSQLTFGGYASPTENHLVEAARQQHIFFPKIV